MFKSDSDRIIENIIQHLLIDAKKYIKLPLTLNHFIRAIILQFNYTKNRHRNIFYRQRNAIN